MGWFERRRQKRISLIAAEVARHLIPTAPGHEDAISTLKVLNELSKMRLESEKLALDAEIERIKATAEDRKDERDYQRKMKEADRARRAAASDSMRNLRKMRGKKLGGGIPEQYATCEDCRAALEGRKPAHNNDMVRHGEQRHADWLRNYHTLSTGTSHAAPAN